MEEKDLSDLLHIFGESLAWYNKMKNKERRCEIDDSYIYDECVDYMPRMRGDCLKILEILNRYM